MWASDVETVVGIDNWPAKHSRSKIQEAKVYLIGLFYYHVYWTFAFSLGILPSLKDEVGGFHFALLHLGETG